MITSCSSWLNCSGLLVRWSDRVVFLDVAVAHPAAPSRGNSTAPLAAARALESAKRKKYARLAARQGASFLAFAVETYGAFGAQAEQVIKLIVSRNARFSFGPRSRALPAQFLAVAIQKGNALVARYGALAARSIAHS